MLFVIGFLRVPVCCEICFSYCGTFAQKGFWALDSRSYVVLGQLNSLLNRVNTLIERIIGALVCISNFHVKFMVGPRQHNPILSGHVAF